MPEAGPLVLFGGIYDWYDPGLLLSAWPEIRKRVPDARLLFFESPNPDTTPQGVFEAARTAAKAIDPEGRSIVFSPWLPYASPWQLAWCSPDWSTTQTGGCNMPHTPIPTCSRSRGSELV